MTDLLRGSQAPGLQFARDVYQRLQRAVGLAPSRDGNDEDSPGDEDVDGDNDDMDGLEEQDLEDALEAVFHVQNGLDMDVMDEFNDPDDSDGEDYEP